jgi:phosphoadenosine phosphosulfate reductase
MMNIMCDFEEQNMRLEKMNPAEILSWVVFQAFTGKHIAATSSFQSQSLPLLYLISKICPFLPIYFLDTGYHFPETIKYINDLGKRLQLNIVSVQSLHEKLDDGMYSTNPDMCCYLRKVEPLQRAFKNVDVWISGIRRDQTQFRKDVRIIEDNAPLGVIKVSPMANVTSSTVKEINARIGLPEHPLRAKGYVSIGCMPCTTVPIDNNERSGRWAGKAKTECGLHFNSNKTKTQSHT